MVVWGSLMRTTQIGSSSCGQVQTMAANTPLLSDLAPGPFWDRIIVRASRIWNSITKVTKEVYSLNLQLLDIQGNQMHAVVPKNLVDKFANTFMEQSIYEIESFNVYPSKTDYRPINEPMMIILRRDTHVNSLSPTLYDIPKYKFEFVGDDVLPQRVDKLDQLIDIAGVLNSISGVKPNTTRRGCQTIMRELTLLTSGSKTASITLWADKTNLIDVPTAESHNKPPSLIFTAMSVKLFRGEFTFSSTNDTQMYCNLEYALNTNLFPRLPEGEDGKIKTINHHWDVGSPKEDTQVRTTISAMLTDIKANDCHGKKYAVLATIMKVNTSNGWSYLSCPPCRKTVTKDGTSFECPKCKSPVPNPLNRYRLSMEVFDHTASATVVCFDKEAATLLKRNVDEMLELSKKDNGPDMVDKIFNMLLGVEACFEFKPTQYEIINRAKSLTVSTISNVHQPYAPTTAKSIKLEDNETRDLVSTQQTFESSTLTNDSNVVVDIKGKKKNYEESDYAYTGPKETNRTPAPTCSSQHGTLSKVDLTHTRGKTKTQKQTLKKRKKK